MPAAGVWSRGRPCTSLSLLCRSWVLIASIACIITIISIYGIVVIITDLCIYVLVLSLPHRMLAP
jgi:hypothetical protein